MEKILLIAICLFVGQSTAAPVTGVVDFNCGNGSDFSGSLNMSWVNANTGSGSRTIYFIGMEGTKLNSSCLINLVSGDFEGRGEFGKCARKSEKAVGEIILVYEISIISSSSNQIISRQPSGVSVVFSCKFTDSYNATFSSDIDVSVLNQTVNQEDSVVQGSFDVGFKLISAANPLQVTDIVKLEASLNVNTADEDVMFTYLDSCWATKSADKNSSPKYDLYKDGCIIDSTASLQNNISNVLSQLSFQMFIWLDNYNAQVFFHCKIRICNEDCKPVCSNGRKKRDVNGELLIKSLGPFYVQKPNFRITDQVSSTSKWLEPTTGSKNEIVVVLVAWLHTLITWFAFGFIKFIKK